MSLLAQATRSDLEARLLQREDEIERLKTRLEQGTAAESDPNKSPEQRRKAEEVRLRACQASVEAHIQELSKFLKDNGLEQVNPTGQCWRRSLHASECPTDAGAYVPVISIPTSIDLEFHQAL